ncbi:MAG: hypothetical protein IJD27_01540 [Alistipes sp.]|nr:hypothetical protein [Alistipes sp.]
MKKIAQITIMLAVYLVWVCSNPVIALSCRANHSKHIHCCSKQCDCHHEDSEKLHFESPHSCHHDHSNKITLYDISKEQKIDIEPVISSVGPHLPTPDAQLSTPHSSLLSSHHFERGVPIPLSPTLSRHGMRAPPVVA